MSPPRDSAQARLVTERPRLIFAANLHVDRSNVRVHSLLERTTMTHAIQDLRFAARQLAHQRMFGVLFIVTLALGIGAATTCFSVLNAVALRPIPFPDPDQLVTINMVAPDGSGRAPLTLQGFRALTEIRGVFSGLAAHQPGMVTMAALGTAERVAASEITGDIFSVLGTPVQVGRPIQDADAGSRVAVVGNGTPCECLDRRRARWARRS